MKEDIAESIEYLNPTCPKTGGDLFVPAVSELKGKVIAFVTNGWSSFNKIGVRLEHVLVAQYGIKGVRNYTIPSAMAPEQGLYDRIARECDAAVVGMAN